MSRAMDAPQQPEDQTMAAIGYLNRQPDGSYKGVIKTLSIRRSVMLLPNGDKDAGNQPDYRLFTDDRERVELGAAWTRVGQTSGTEYVSLSLAAPEFGPRKLYANLGRAAGQDDPDTYAIIWNPAD
ncbi:DUF736 family protein [Thalassobaculum sp.]|uniref:DUF736 domain-containing protein n=1 Tax=Thalassobaculum sp. TaxID=2022740 RepID=UPI0032ED5F20